jgi:hypothetical protein
VNSSKNRAMLLLFLLASVFAGAARAQLPSLTITEALWARIDDGGRLVACDGKFRRGEGVHLILRDVGPFPAGPDGRSWFDMDMTVTSPSGRVVLDKKGLLGENGRATLKNGRAESPYGYYESSVTMEPGTYTMVLTIRDRIGSAQATVTKEFNLSAGLSYGKAVFARKDAEGRMDPLDAAVFNRGEEVHLLYLNVGRFSKGPDGRHAFDIDMEVKGPDGEIVIARKDMLGEEGHIVLDDDIAGSPYATFFSTITNAPGAYTMQVTIRDKIGNAQVSVTKQFALK